MIDLGPGDNSRIVGNPEVVVVADNMAQAMLYPESVYEI
jgi:hypothetical protein